jgi:hypothetical protein
MLVLAIYSASAAPTTSPHTPQKLGTSWTEELNALTSTIYGARCSTTRETKNQCAYCDEGGSCKIHWVYTLVMVIMVFMFVLIALCLAVGAVMLLDVTKLNNISSPKPVL